MNLDIDPAKILYAVGAVFGVAALLYFARDIVFDLSITVRAILLFLVFVLFLFGAVAASQSLVVTVSSVFAAAAYLAFLWYTLSRFDVGADGTFLALLVSAVLFMGLGYAIRERGVKPTRAQTRYVIVGIVLLGAAFVGADVAASGVTYDVDIADEASIESDGGVAVGTLTVDSDFVFREPIDAPRAYACIYVSGLEEYEFRPQPVQYRVGDDRLPDTVPGTGSITARMTVGLTDDERRNVSGPIGVERAETCPEDSDESRIVVVLGDDVPRPPGRP